MGEGGPEGPEGLVGGGALWPSFESKNAIQGFTSFTSIVTSKG